MLDVGPAFAAFPLLETERLILRQPAAGDAPDVFRIFGDPRVMRYIGKPTLQSLDEAAAKVQLYRQAFEERTGIRWAILRRVDGRYLGSCGFWRLFREHFRAEIGFEL